MTLAARDKAILAHLWKQPGASIREMMAACDIPSTSLVTWRLRRLNHLGYIKPRPPWSERTHRLTPAGLLAAQGFEMIFWEPAAATPLPMDPALEVLP